MELVAEVVDCCGGYSFRDLDFESAAPNVVLASHVPSADALCRRAGGEWVAMAADSPISQLLKHGLRFSLGAALLTGLFGHRGNLLDNYVYPIFGYLSVVIEPSTGGAITAGLGRLGGSALGGLIAAILVYAFGLEGSSYYVIPPLTFILASLICETYRWQAAYSQATLIGTLIAMRAVGNSGQTDIWIYVKSRLIDNWIGVMVGLAVVLLFWPQESRTELAKGLRQFLQQVPLLFAAVIDRTVFPQPPTLLAQLTHLTQTSQKTLAAASTEFQSEALTEENWGAILDNQTQIARQLASLADLLAGEQSPLVDQIVEALKQFTDDLTHTCDALNGVLNDALSTDLSDPRVFAALHQDILQMETKLETLRSTGAFDRYTVAEALQCFQLIELCRQLARALQVLQNNLQHRANIVVNHQRRAILTFPKWTAISYSRVIEIVGIAMAVGMILAIIHHIEFPYPSAYSKVASLVMVGGLIMLVQPIRGKVIALGLAATVCMYITIFIIYLVATAFGFNPVSSAIVYFLIYMSCAVLGFTPIARIGAIIAAVIFGKDIALFFEQGLIAAAIAIPSVVLISLLITSLFMGGSAANQFNQSLAQTYRRLGQLYQALLNRYLQGQNQGQNTEAEVAQLKQIIAGTLAQHPLILKVAGLELGTSAMAAQQKSRWTLWFSHEQQLLTWQ